MPAAKKRSTSRISAAPSNGTGLAVSEDKDHPTGDAVKKSKLEEDDNQALHQTRTENEDDDNAMEMDTGDSDEERFITKEDISGLTPEELAQIEEDKKLMEAMGFPTHFGSTKGKPVEGNNIYVAHKVKVRKVRQLVNKKTKPKSTGRPNPHIN